MPSVQSEFQNNPGLIPRICEALFSSMAEGREAGTTYK